MQCLWSWWLKVTDGLSIIFDMVFSQPINLASCCLTELFREWQTLQDAVFKFKRSWKRKVLISFLKQEIGHVSDKKSPRDTKMKWLSRKNVYRDFDTLFLMSLVYSWNIGLVINCMPSKWVLYKNWKAWLNEKVYMFVLSTPFFFLFSLVINLRKKEMSASCFNLLRGTLTQLAVQWVVNRVSHR